jgi:hypothetical protein
MNRALLILLAAAGALGGPFGCGNTGVVCGKTEVRCGNTCADLSKNPEHCGACGVTCAASFICSGGACSCPAPQTACGQSCVDLNNSGGNCGACGQACSGDQVCDRGSCVARCGGAGTICGGGCVDTQTDPVNCGGCAGTTGKRCAQGESCRGGACGPDLYAACFNSGGLYGVSATTLAVTPTRQVAPPQAPVGLAFHGSHTLEVADADARLLYAFDVTQGLVPGTAPLAIGGGPTSVTIAGDLAVVVNSGDATLDVFDLSQDGGTRLCAAGASTCTATARFAANSYPQYAAVTDQAIFVSLAGDVFAPNDLVGNRVAIVSRPGFQVGYSSPIVPDRSTSDGGATDAGSVDGGGYQARPQGLAVVGNRLFVALADLGGASRYDAIGPGEVAIFDLVPPDGGLQPHGLPVKLGDGCLNAGALLVSGQRLFVACGPRYDGALQAAAPGALAALDTTTLLPAFPPATLSCPGGTSGCKPGGATRLALSGGKLFLGDSVDGRIFVADPQSGQITSGAGSAINVCLAPDGGFDMVSDLVARP